jgi:hypothetical protein
MCRPPYIALIKKIMVAKIGSDVCPQPDKLGKGPCISTIFNEDTSGSQ